MNWLLFAAFVLVAYHLIWEMAIAPTLRMRFRNRIFALRDELRRHLIAQPGRIGDHAAGYLEDSLNTAITYMDRLQIDTLIASRRAYQRDMTYRQKVDQRSAAIDGDRLTGELHDRLARISFDAFMVNIGGWFIYLVPPLLVFRFAQLISGTIGGVFSVAVQDVEEHVPRFRSGASRGLAST